MIRPRSWTSGNRDEFAVKLSFAPDPDAGRGASDAMSASWGSFEIWVNGLNLCQHRELDRSVDAVHWYLLPLLRWFVTNWDALLHEERLPNQNVGRDAWISLRATAEPPRTLTEDQSDSWEESQQAWWSRHSLLSCRDGGLFPNIFIRRMRDSVEFSWGPTALCGAPHHYEFFASHGYARIDPDVVADHLSHIIGSAILHLANEESGFGEYQELQTKFQNIQSEDRFDQQLALICGLRDRDGTRQGRISGIIRKASTGAQATHLAPFLSEKRSRLVIRESPQVCLMFGSIAPNIEDEDVERLIDLLASVQRLPHEAPSLRSMVRDQPIRSALERPWERGYQLADLLHEELSDRYRLTRPVDIERLFKEFEIAVKEVALTDKSIRAIAIAGENCQPTVAINSNYRYQHSHPRRFTLAHELCHLLYDRTHGIRLALASGPWAPADVEKRANAFAAMFLMPPELIQVAVEEMGLDLETVADLWKLSGELGVSFSAAVEHLHNLGFLDEEARDELKQRATQASTAAPQ